MKHRILFTVEVELEIDEDKLVQELGTANLAEAENTIGYSELILGDFGNLYFAPEIPSAVKFEGFQTTTVKRLVK